MIEQDLIRRRSEIIHEMAALNDFMSYDNCKKLCSEKEKALLKDQFRIMGEYQAVLGLRIELLKKEDVQF